VCNTCGHRGSRDHRGLYVEDILEDLGALAEDLVVSGGREEVETIRGDLGTEFVARAALTRASWTYPLNTSGPSPECNATSRIPSSRFILTFSYLLR
jgi:hypothetical protein